ncbi:hypothetical protein HY493_02670 [Candidatus Woesearchaeota archaeon]|nr:hypothetical protein [Candidatus Woesearchaeota archaeon]
MDADVITRNLEKMLDANVKGAMIPVVNSESLGGNAGRFLLNGIKYQCVGANFFYDAQTGEILSFSLTSNPPFPGAARGVFKIACETESGTYKYSAFRIIEWVPDKHASPHANKIIEQTKNVYNKVADEHAP